MATNFTEKNISAIELGNIKYNLKSVPFHATEAEWLSINYIPKQGEMIVYDIDEVYNYPRFKHGDGVTEVNTLPFSLASLTEIYLYINNQIGSAGHLKRVILASDQELPSIEEAQIDTIYMKLSSQSRLITDAYDEYMVINGSWEIIGNTRVDLSNYITFEKANEMYLQSVSAGQGLKVTDKNYIEIDSDVIFILNAGTSEEVI